MRMIFILAAGLLLSACASNPQSLYEQSVQAGSGPIANSNLEALHIARPIPLPLSSGAAPQKWAIDASQPRMSFGTSISNYRVFSLELKKGEPYALNVNSLCNNRCLGFNKFALKPRALLLDSYGTVIASKPSRGSAVVGLMSLSWEGIAPEDGTYYLLVAADNDELGKTIVLDNLWVNNSPLMAVKTDMHSAPFGQVTVYSSRHE